MGTGASHDVSSPSSEATTDAEMNLLGHEDLKTPV